MLSRFRRVCRLANLLSITIAEGENNMGGTKGSALANIGYSCEQKALVAGWRRVWSEILLANVAALSRFNRYAYEPQRALLIPTQLYMMYT